MATVIAGYYGFGNAGDELILYSLIRRFRRNNPKLSITVLSQKPLDTERIFDVHAVNRWRPWTWIAVVVDHVREHATDAGSILVLHEHLAVIGIAAHRCKNHRNRFRAKITARRNACTIVVNPADGHVADEIDSPSDGFLKSKSISGPHGARVVSGGFRGNSARGEPLPLHVVTHSPLRFWMYAPFFESLDTSGAKADTQFGHKGGRG